MRWWLALFMAMLSPVAFAGATPTKLAVQPIGPVTVHVPFSVTVTSVNNGNTTTAVLANTTVTLSLSSGSGVLAGTLTGYITAGTDTVVIAGLTLDTVQNGAVITATATAGDPLTADPSSAFNVVPGAPHHLTILTQPSAAATAGAAFSQQPVVRVFDQNGYLCTNNSSTSVTVSLASGTGSLTGTANVTASAGVATFAGLALTGAGTSTLSFTSTGLTGATSADVVVSPAAAHHLTIQTQPSTAATAGVALVQQPIIHIKDQYDNLCSADNTSQVTVSSAGGLTGTPTLTPTLTASSGVVTFSGLALTVAGNQTLSFSSGLLTGATSGTVVVSPAAAHHLTIATQPSASATAGVTIAQQPVVHIADVYGNVCTSDSTTQVTVSSAGGLTGALPLTASSGVVTFSGLALTVAGNQTLSFASSGLTGATTTAVAVSPAAANRLTMQTQPTANVTAGVTFPQQPAVRIEDQFGNTCTGDSATQVTVSSVGNVTGTTTVMASSGVVTFSGLAMTVAGNQTLSFVSGVLTSATSALVVVSPAAASRLSIQIQPSSTAIAGVAFAQQPVVRIEDQFGNLRSSDSATSVTVSSAGTLTGTIAVTSSDGVATFSDLALTTAGSQTLVFASSGLTGATSNTITVGSASATRLVITGTGSQVAGATQALTITARDAFNNVATSYAGIKSLIFNGPSVALLGGTAPTVTNAGGTPVSIGDVTDITFTAGVATVGGTLRVVRVESIALGVATQGGGLVAAGADRLSLSVTPATTHHLVVTGPTSAVAASTIALELQAEDQFGNLATGFTQTLSVDLLGVVNGNQGEVATCTDLAGVAQPTTGGANTTLQFSGGIAGAAQARDQCVLRPMRAGVATITATGGSLVAGTALNVTVASAAASKLVVTGVGSTSPIAGSATTVSVAAADAGGNVVTVPADVDLVITAAPTAASLDGSYTGARIDSGSSTTTISGVILRRAESGVVLAVADQQVAGLKTANSPTLAVQNDAPVLTIAGTTLNYIGGSGPIPFGWPGISVSDNNSGGFSPYFQGTVLTATITSGLVPTEDVLQVRSSDVIRVTGTTIKHNNVAIATVTGGIAGAPLVVTITASTVTPAVMADLLKNLSYHNVGGVSPTLGTRIITLGCSDGSVSAPGGAKSAVAVTRSVQIQVGNALPVLVNNTGLSVTRGSTTTISEAALKATDQETPASGVVYKVTTFPKFGDLVLGSGMSAVVLSADVGGTTTFTQDDISSNRLSYRHAGGSDLGDSFSFEVGDGTAHLSSTSFSIIIPGAASNPVLFLPISTLNYTEGAPQPTVVLANAPYVTGTQISDADTFDFANGQLTVEIVDANGVADFHAGDRLGVRSQTLTGFGQFPSQPFASDMLQTGFIARIGDDIVRRQHFFCSYWMNVISFYPDPGPLPFPSPETLTSYPISWYYGTTTPLDYPIATINPSKDGVGKTLHFTLLSGASNATGEPIVSSQAIAHLIDNLTYENVSDAPPSRTRYLRITLAEASPSTSVGVVTVPLVVTPQNDAPVFSIPAPGPPTIITAVAGVPLRIGVRAEDPDLAAGTQLSYALVRLSQPGAGVAVLNATSGALVFTPLATFTGPVDIWVRAIDDLGSATSAVVSINVLAGPTPEGPLVISDPPFESIVAEDLDYALSIRPDPAVAGAITSVTATLVGDYPAGAVMQSGATALTPVLHASALTRPADGVYTFGIRVALNYAGGAVEIGYQPVTFKVRGTGADN